MRNIFKFKAGDQIRIKKELIIGETYSMQNSDIASILTKEMSQHLGERATIMAVSEKGYTLDISPRCYFVDEMLKRVIDLKAKSLYTPIKEVEEFHEHMLCLVKKQQIDQALDTRNKKLFSQLLSAEKYKK
ncbi:IDEAL domain-containing protein [Bacillus haynesii]|uniref:IDEAL domain-containing protein n=1 Tax=Bacillus haynesii TaxID=1925021 RepID=UPI00227E670C|nr:IDEAL domain-containing protein [Bacillus haynesii]MCY8549395.1 IDEAL domain-containing protein [Bacillus haynesii]